MAVDYRLAPEHPFPAAVEDGYVAAEWVADHPDELGGDGRVAVIGDSAGGGLALLARDRNGPGLARQTLVYPVVEPGRRGRRTSARATSRRPTSTGSRTARGAVARPRPRGDGRRDE